MRFIITRTSDSFRECPLPDKSLSPHPRALWDEEKKTWIVNLISLEHLVDLCDKEISLVLRRKDGLSIEIDDVGL